MYRFFHSLFVIYVGSFMRDGVVTALFAEAKIVAPTGLRI